MDSPDEVSWLVMLEGVGEGHSVSGVVTVGVSGGDRDGEAGMFTVDVSEGGKVSVAVEESGVAGGDSCVSDAVAPVDRGS